MTIAIRLNEIGWMIRSRSSVCEIGAVHIDGIARIGASPDGDLVRASDVGLNDAASG